jgi:hypothetical protein
MLRILTTFKNGSAHHPCVSADDCPSRRSVERRQGLLGYARGPRLNFASAPNSEMTSRMQEPADGIIDHYERHARAWDADRRMGGWTDKPWHDRFIAALPSAANILDLGCGSGSPVARHMAERGFHVTGVDSSPTPISLCRERLPDHEWLVAHSTSCTC